MSLLLLELDRNDASDRSRCVVRHGKQEIRATIVCEPSKVDDLLGQTFSAEYEIEEITRTEMDLPLDNESSGLFSTNSGIVVDGTIHQIHDVDNGNFLYDIYIMNGPEFVVVTTEQLDGLSPSPNSRIRVFANNLTVYPTFT